MRAPKFAKGDIVRSRLDPSVGWIVTGFVSRFADEVQWLEYVCEDPHGAETIRRADGLEVGERTKDPAMAD